VSEIIANTHGRIFATENDMLGEYTEKLSFEINPLSPTPCNVSVWDGCDQNGVAYFQSLKDAEEWFTQCLQKIKEVLGE